MRINYNQHTKEYTVQLTQPFESQIQGMPKQKEITLDSLESLLGFLHDITFMELDRTIPERQRNRIRTSYIDMNHRRREYDDQIDHGRIY